MSETTPDRHPSIIPGLRYADAPAAIEWLCEAFGFEATLVVPGEEEGAIAHAQLVLGNGMIMLGSAGTHAGSAIDEAMRPAGASASLKSQPGSAVTAARKESTARRSSRKRNPLRPSRRW